MDIFQENSIKRLLKIEIITLILFCIASFLFYNFEASHSYYHKGEFDFSIVGIVAFFALGLKIIFFWIILIFPILFFIQIFLLARIKRVKNYYKKLFIIIILYLLSIVSLYSLFSIDNKENFKNIKKINFKENKY